MSTLSPRWRKVWRDLAANRARSALMVVSIAVGTFAVGFVGDARVVVLQALAISQAQAAPASATLVTAEPFDGELVDALRRTPGVADLQGRRALPVRGYLGGAWRNLELFALPDYRDVRIGRLDPAAGAWPPPERGLLLERDSLASVGARIGDTAVLEMADGTSRALPVAGTVHDMNYPASTTLGRLYAYTTPATIEWLGQPYGLNQLLLRVGAGADASDRAQAEQVAAGVRRALEEEGRAVVRVEVPEPGKFWADEPVNALVALTSILSVLSVVLSGFLVSGALQSLLAQHVRQIGVMKAIGARVGDLVAMYLMMVGALGVAAVAIAIPLGALAGAAVVRYSTSRLNLAEPAFALAPSVVALQVAVGVVVPLLAGLGPVLAACRTGVRQAIAATGGAPPVGGGRLDRALERVRGLPRPLLLSLRNTVRQPVRLVLTLAALSLAGALFVAVASVQASLGATLDDAYQFRNPGIELDLAAPAPITQIERAARSVAGVAAAESWAYYPVQRLRSDDVGSGGTIALLAPPALVLSRPVLLEGRWLVPDDENALVVNTDVLVENPDLRVGGTVRFRLNDERTTWRIVGLARGVVTDPSAYANATYLARLVGEVGLASRVRVKPAGDRPTAELARAIEEAYRRADLPIQAVRLGIEQRAVDEANFSVVVGFLVQMAALLALVGGLGLTGAMGMNVLERTREIGVMRAIGASDGTIARLVVAEGVLIGLASCVIGLAAALPLGRMLADVVGMAFLRAPLHYSFALGGAGLWLLIALGLAALASLLPARSAARLTVRDALAYA